MEVVVPLLKEVVYGGKLVVAEVLQHVVEAEHVCVLSLQLAEVEDVVYLLYLLLQVFLLELQAFLLAEGRR